MKFLIPLFLIIISMSCSNSTEVEITQENDTLQQDLHEVTDSLQINTTKPAKPIPIDSSLIWLNNQDIPDLKNNFQEFRNAILNNDRKKVKSFFDFPITTEGNQLWFLIDQKFYDELEPEKLISFTEADFDKYYDSIFRADFKEGIRLINVDELFTRGNAATSQMDVIKDSKSVLYANIYASDLTLNLNSWLTTGEDSEFSIIYVFRIVDKKTIRFSQVQLAG